MGRAKPPGAASTFAYLALSVPAYAQCEPRWLSGPGGFDRPVLALARAGTELVAGGLFSVAPGGVPASGIARFDGEAWHPVGSGVGASAATGVRDIIAYEGSMLAAGNFVNPPGCPDCDFIARWDGASWNPMGLELSNMFWPPAQLWPSVNAVAVFGGDLIAGGHFEYANGIDVNHVIRWDGAAWQPMGGGIEGYSVNGFVVHNGALIAAGQTVYPFTQGGSGFVLRWTGSSWEPLGTMTSCGSCSASHVGPLVIHGGALWAGGRFLNAGGTPAQSIARQDGMSWQGAAQGILASQFGGAGEVFALAPFRGELIAGGSFAYAGLGPAGNIARWDGQAWHALDSGIAEPTPDGPGVADLLPSGNDLYVAGAFTVAGGLSSPFLARWGCACYADCNNSGTLSVADFGCFQTQFVAGDHYADCNADGGLTLADFGCFQSKFAAGCP